VEKKAAMIDRGGSSMEIQHHTLVGEKYSLKKGESISSWKKKISTTRDYVSSSEKKGGWGGWVGGLVGGGGGGGRGRETILSEGLFSYRIDAHTGLVGRRGQFTSWAIIILSSKGI